MRGPGVSDGDVENLRHFAQKWDEHVAVLSGAIDDLVEPWAAPAMKVAAAAKIGALSHVNEQVCNFTPSSGLLKRDSVSLTLLYQPNT